MWMHLSLLIFWGLEHGLSAVCSLNKLVEIPVSSKEELVPVVCSFLSVELRRGMETPSPFTSHPPLPGFLSFGIITRIGDSLAVRSLMCPSASSLAGTSCNCSRLSNQDIGIGALLLKQTTCSVCVRVNGCYILRMDSCKPHNENIELLLIPQKTSFVLLTALRLPYLSVVPDS